MTTKAAPPWGTWEVLFEAKTYKVKRIVVNPGKRLSYQKHKNRKEHWVMVEGEASITLDGKKISLKSGETIDIPANSAHRISNEGKAPLVFVEIQTGNYLGEDDIERLEDDYGRAGTVG